MTDAQPARDAQGKSKRRGSAAGAAAIAAGIGITAAGAVEVGALVWDASRGVYIVAESGAVVGAAMLQRIARESRERASETFAAQAERFAAGTITAAVLAERLRGIVLAEGIRQYTLGRGGIEVMSLADWQTIAGLTRIQFRFLDAAITALEKGARSVAQFAAQTRMYVNATHIALERARSVAAESAGMTQEKWNIVESTEHCPDCLVYQGEGWKHLGYFPTPGDGSTACKSNCVCFKSYRRSGKVIGGVYAGGRVGVTQ